MSLSVSSQHHAVRQPPERRGGASPIPLNLREFLNEDQRRSLRQVEGFGWELAFVRRPLFQDPVVVIRNSECTAFSVLEDDGTINDAPNIIIRH